MRVVCHFSCGATSAVATKLTLHDYPDALIVNAFLEEEEPDNRRFLADCEEWFGKPVIVLRDEKFGASTREVFRRKRYLKGQMGAPCAKALKRDVLDAFALPGDQMALGYSIEEAGRLADFRAAFPDRKVLTPLIDRNLSKPDCLAIIERAGIQLPFMYRLGYSNANCVGCVKGGEGYWNKIRMDFPERFEEMAQIQEEIGPGAYLFRNRKTGERYSLRQLHPDAGRNEAPVAECSFFCAMTEAELEAK